MTPKAHPQKLEWKLTSLTLQTCTLVLLLVLAATLAYDTMQSRREVLKDALVLADIIGQLGVESVAPGDEAAARGMLTHLRFDPDIVSVVPYRVDGEQLAQFAREKHEVPVTLELPATSGKSHRFEGHELVVSLPIRNVKGVGTLVLRENIAGQHARLQVYLLIAGGLLVLAFCLASFLQRVISRRIRELSQVATRIAQDNDYSVRTDSHCDDENSTLADASNGRLTRTERQTCSLVEGEARLRQLGEAAFEGLAIVVEGKLVDCNPQLAKMFGYEGPEMIGRPVLDFAAPESRELVVEHIRTGGETSYEALYLRKDGSVFPGESHARRLERQGKQVCMMAIRDLTERKQAEAALCESEERFQQIFRAAPVLISLSEVADGCYVVVNDRFCAVSGFSQQEVVGRTPVELGWFSAADRGRLIAELEANGRVREMELIHRCKDGREVVCLYAAELVVVGGRKLLLSIANHISGCKRTEAELKANRRVTADALAFSRRVLDTSPAGILTFSASGRCLLANETAATMSGTKVAGLLRQNLFQMPTWKEAGLYDASFQALDTGRPVQLEVWHTTTSGERLCLKLLVSSFVSGVNTHFLVIIADITQQKLVESSLLEAKQHLEAHIANSPLGIIEFDPDMCVTRWSGAAQQIFGWSETEILGQAILEILWVHEDDVESMRQISAEMRAGCQQRNLQVDRNYRKDGTVISCEWYNSALYDGQGRLTSIFSLVLDITARRQVETVMRELASIVEYSADAIIGQTGDGVITSWNRSAERIYGYPAAEVIGRPLALLLPPDESGDVERTVRQFHTGSRGQEFETVGRRKDGTLIEVAMSLSPIRNEGYGLTAASMIVRDITERKRLEREILRVGAEERRRLSYELHDSLGQTLTGIAFKAKALQGSLVKAASPLAKDLGEVATLVSGAIAETRRLAQGLHPLEIENAGLVAALAGLAAKTQHLFGLECIFHCSETKLSAAPATEAVLYRITQEAIHNAVSHGSPHTIEIELSRIADGLQLFVRDDGKGFDAAAIESSGMGLRSIQHRVRAHGGTLKIRSQPGEGTRIECSLPLAELLVDGGGQAAGGPPLTSDL
jgi:PAS domain S-box-containing protein